MIYSVVNSLIFFIFASNLHLAIMHAKYIIFLRIKQNIK